MNDDINSEMRIDELSSLGELATVEEIITEASAATDEGNYAGALEGFEQALEMTQRIFGDNIELTELKSKIADIHEILDEQSLE